MLDTKHVTHPGGGKDVSAHPQFPLAPKQIKSQTLAQLTGSPPLVNGGRKRKKRDRSNLPGRPAASPAEIGPVRFSRAKVPAVRQEEGVAKLKAPIVQFLNSGEQEQADYLYELLDSACSAALKPGLGRCEAVLKSLGYGGPVNDCVRNTLYHCTKLRNCIAHNDGIVDSRLVNACPWWKGTEGTRVGITAAMSQKHFYAVCWYMMEVQRRILPSDLEGLDKLTEEQNCFVKSIEKGGTPEHFPFAGAPDDSPQ